MGELGGSGTDAPVRQVRDERSQVHGPERRDRDGTEGGFQVEAELGFVRRP